MKVVKLKAGISITLADQQAPLGRTPSGAVIFPIYNVPDSVSLHQVWKRYRYHCLPMVHSDIVYYWQTNTELQ
jgi:hypothetical protein